MNARSFEYVIKGVTSTTVRTLDLNHPGDLGFCVFFHSDHYAYTLDEDEIEVLDFGKLSVYNFTTENDDSVYNGVYEKNTGIMLFLEVHDKGKFEEGEEMGYYEQISSTDIDFYEYSVN